MDDEMRAQMVATLHDLLVQLEFSLARAKLNINL